eukprot:995919-Pleurochrysis_carterae.AAC.1
MRPTPLAADQRTTVSASRRPAVHGGVERAIKRRSKGGERLQGEQRPGDPERARKGEELWQRSW